MTLRKSTLTILGAAFVALNLVMPSAESRDFGPDQFTATKVTRHADFYVGGSYVERSGKQFMTGQMYVEGWAPAHVLHRYPIVMIPGLLHYATEPIRNIYGTLPSRWYGG